MHFWWFDTHKRQEIEENLQMIKCSPNSSCKQTQVKALFCNEHVDDLLVHHLVVDFRKHVNSCKIGYLLMIVELQLAFRSIFAYKYLLTLQQAKIPNKKQAFLISCRGKQLMNRKNLKMKTFSFIRQDRENKRALSRLQLLKYSFEH